MRESSIYLTYTSLYPDDSAILSSMSKIYSMEPVDLLELSHPFIEKFREITSNYEEPLNIKTTAKVGVEDGKINVQKPISGPIKFKDREFTGISSSRKYSLSREFEKMRNDFLDVFEYLEKYPTRSNQEMSITIRGFKPRKIIHWISDLFNP